MGPPQTRFRAPSLIVASIDDPYGPLPYARMRAERWGGDLTVIGAAGHINCQSKLGTRSLTLRSDFLRPVFGKNPDLGGER
ncbi:alpha/beta hydrolase [Agrobacterium tumefaciens]|uniref:alpha/beta hydrolase n=1 Tax=Agrobacterium tumefaciens TaxID=358 RepID=UPI001F42B6B5|nr:alpha/beta hydrolase [Agrobacterium tumefaciens]